MAIFIDVAGAFDNLLWPILFKRLQDLSIPYTLYQLFRSYTNDRVVRYDSLYHSINKPSTTGCPQGSVLGPFMWNIVMATLLHQRWPESCHPVAYAGDLAIAIATTSRLDLESKAWYPLGVMKINSKYPLESPNIFPKLSYTGNPVVRFNGQSLKRVNVYKYLGVMIDERLSFYDHARYVSTECFSDFTRIHAKELG